MGVGPMKIYAKRQKLAGIRDCQVSRSTDPRNPLFLGAREVFAPAMIRCLFSPSSFLANYLPIQNGGFAIHLGSAIRVG